MTLRGRSDSPRLDPAVGLGYTLATGRLFATVGDFQEFAERLLGRSVWTHEFADEAFWDELRTTFEERYLRENGRDG